MVEGMAKGTRDIEGTSLLVMLLLLSFLSNIGDATSIEKDCYKKCMDYYLKKGTSKAASEAICIPKCLEPYSSDCEMNCVRDQCSQFDDGN